MTRCLIDSGRAIIVIVGPVDPVAAVLEASTINPVNSTNGDTDTAWLGLIDHWLVLGSRKAHMLVLKAQMLLIAPVATIDSACKVQTAGSVSPLKDRPCQLLIHEVILGHLASAAPRTVPV